MGKLNELCKDFWHNFNELKNNVESHTGILTGVGIGLAVTGTILACRATLKVSQKSEEHIKLIEDTKANCAEAQMTEKETRKAVMKSYRHIGVDYVRQYWPAVGLTIIGFGFIIKAHCIEVAKNEALMGAYVALQGLFAKYRARVAERIGEEQEQDVYKLAQIDQANEHLIGKDYDGPFVNGSYLLFNESCTDYEEGCPQANAFVIDTAERTLNQRYLEGRRVYINDVMRAFGHDDVNNGWKWCWYKGLTDKIDFKLHDPDHNPEFAKGYGFATNGDTIAKLFLNGCVHVSETYKSENRRNELADGGVCGGELGKDLVIIG